MWLMMRHRLSLTYVALNVVILAGIAWARSYSAPLAYELGGIYAGVIIGAYLTIISQSLSERWFIPLREAINMIFRGEGRRLRLNQQEGGAILGLSLVFVAMTIIGDYRFLGQSLGSNHLAAVIGMGIIGAIYAMILWGLLAWFDHWIWRGGLLDYAIALGAFVFIISIVGALSGAFVKTPLFAVGIGSRAVSSVIILKWRGNAHTGVGANFYVSVIFLLILALILRA
jgi:hypothetical protein